ncbi:hypothetical protein [Paracoccus sp. IB05]|uniref:hypothetical protein n=1 Tax=Paracoccus sp. IB05 TaxID=2779367 RepID=UPI0018E7C80A|nr:hypothetical protein [Paracoccus sp. IB05]MBJ2151966.1 hypothetical protein [Paracoccus sp. IB05]
MRLALSALIVLTAAPAGALTPLPPCGGVEAGMRTGFPAQIEGTGIVVEDYSHNITAHGDLAEADTPPVAALSGFTGLRITHCASGRMVAVAGQGRSYDAANALAATTFLREAVAKKQPATAARMKQAVKAALGKGIELRENAETCACNTYFPDLRAKGMTPYKERNDLGQ